MITKEPSTFLKIQCIIMHDVGLRLIPQFYQD